MEIKGDLKLYLANIEIEFWQAVMSSGGFDNAHTHLDRANTNLQQYWSHYSPTFDPLSAASLPLEVKQDLTGELHKGLAYTKENLLLRMGMELERQFQLGHTKVTTFIDATPDLGRYHGDPLIAAKAALQLKKQLAQKLQLTVIAHPIFGFKDDPEDKPSRLEVFRSAVKIADGIGGLPERDESISWRGYTDHAVTLINLGLELNKPVHIHVDQANNPKENGTERLIEYAHTLNATGLRDKKGRLTSQPMVWLVHSISPACYEEERFKKVLNGLALNNIGVIVCPSAALGMRQLRSITTPTHNSIARILEMMDAGIRIKIGTDNIEDVFMPNGTGRILTEIISVAGDAIRFYQPSIWLKLATGQKLNNMDKKNVRDALRDNHNAWHKASK